MQNKRCEGDGNKVNVRTENGGLFSIFPFRLVSAPNHATSCDLIRRALAPWAVHPITSSTALLHFCSVQKCRSGLVDAYSGKALDLISCACRATKCRRRRRHILELEVFGKQSLFYLRAVF